MKFITSIFIFFYSLCPQLSISLFSEEDTGEIRVALQSTQTLAPVYVARFQQSDNAFSNSYLAELQEAFEFSINYNGFTKVLDKRSDKEERLGLKEIASAFSSKFWKEAGVAYVVKGDIQQSNLTLRVYSTLHNNLKSFTDVALTGQITQDRYTIYKLTDRIQKCLFDVEGVANTRILFCLQEIDQSSKWISEIWECSWNGKDARQITKEASYSVTPFFLPSDQRFANDRFLYVSYKAGQPKIYIASLREGIGKRLISLRGNQLLPTVSTARNKIAFISDASGRTDLFIQPFHPEKGEMGKPLQLFSYPRSTQASPTFSPDGSQIAFVSDKDGSPRIYIIPAVFSSTRAIPQLISKKNRESSCPSWSPDGRKLAFSAKTNGIRQIWIYDFETKEEWQLTLGPGNKENPAWAPDSLHLVFNSTDAHSSELYIVNLHQPEAVKISHGPGKKHYPSWGKR